MSSEEMPEKKAKLEGEQNSVVPEGVLFGMGNPLLDISAEVPVDYLQKYDLKPNDAILAEEKHMPIYKELIDNYQPVKLIAGGATQNSIRVAQWMLRRKAATSYIGCIGKDSYGIQLREKAEGDGVLVRYLEDDKNPTGTCACLITEKVRSLVANLGAANHYQKDHLVQKENWALLEKARIAYIGGFFLTVSPASIVEVGKHCAETNKTFIMNLSAPFIPMVFKDPLLSALPYIDILVGNEAEAAALSQSLNLGVTDLREIAKKLVKHEKINQGRKRIVIFTQGPDPIFICRGDTITEFPILPIKEEEILDTNGAGDAWVGGFLSQLAKDKSIEDCVNGGNYAANVVIKRSGCTYPAEPSYE